MIFCLKLAWLNRLNALFLVYSLLYVFALFIFVLYVFLLFAFALFVFELFVFTLFPLASCSDSFKYSLADSEVLFYKELSFSLKVSSFMIYPSLYAFFVISVIN